MLIWKDYIILVLRKAIFRKEDTIRLAAANAIIDLILMETKSKNIGANSFKDSSSQASCSQQAGLCYRMEFSLFQELTGLLRRCLSHEVCSNWYMMLFIPYLLRKPFLMAFN